MKSFETILYENNSKYSKETINFAIIDTENYKIIRNAIIKYGEYLIDEYERKLNEYDGSVTYSQISNELKLEL